MNSLYEILDQTGRLEDRRGIISNYLRSQDLTKLLPEGSFLSEEMRIPFRDDEISFPFVVGKKYLRDEPHFSPVYVLGIVQTSKSVELLIVEPDEDGIGCLPRNWMESPEVMLQQ